MAVGCERGCHTGPAADSYGNRKGQYARTEGRIVLFTALMKDGRTRRVVQNSPGPDERDYPQNHALYPWANGVVCRSGKKGDGIQYFEKLQAEKLRTSPKLAQYALYEKAVAKKPVRSRRMRARR
jgi:hypothetical protein